MDPGEVAIGDHVRRDGLVYRVVGVDGASVTLLRVTDAEGRRRSTGALMRASGAELGGFEMARDPDAGVRPIRWLWNLGSGLRWEARMVLRGLLGRR